MDSSGGKIRTEAEGRELWLPYAMEFLSQADEIRVPSICRENDDGIVVVIERQLIAITRKSDEAGTASHLAPSSPPDQDFRSQ